MPYLFYTRTQNTCGLSGTIALAHTKISFRRTKHLTKTAESNNITSSVFVRKIFGKSIHLTTIRCRTEVRGRWLEPTGH